MDLCSGCGETTDLEDATHCKACLDGGPDMDVRNEGTIFLFFPLTPAGRCWVRENVADPTWFGGGFVVDHGYAEALASGMLSDGLNLQ